MKRAPANQHGFMGETWARSKAKTAKCLTLLVGAAGIVPTTSRVKGTRALNLEVLS
jgi:hypothetical protein